MQIPYFDAHCDTVSRMARFPGRHLDQRTGQWDLNRLKNFTGPKAQFFAIFYDSALPGKHQAVRMQLAAFQRECRRLPDRIAHCTTARAAEEAFQQGNLTWNHANALSGSHKEEPDRGLSEQGRAFVAKMGELGMLVDVSHLSDPGFWDVMECASGPVMASHSNSRDVFFHTRNLTDGQFTAIIKKHGIVGLNCYTAFLGDGKVTMDTLLRHLEHYLSLGGEHTVALGGDWDGCDKLPQGFEGSWNWLDFYEYLLKRNYPEDLLQDLYFNNLMRTVRAVCTI